MTIWIWLTPAIGALFLYGIGQGLVKKYIAEVPPARFCLYFIVAKAVVNFIFYFSQNGFSWAAFSPILSSESRSFVLTGILAYILDGTGWILYFQSIILGPITIVGTLSAAYPALTVLFARLFLNEVLLPIQYTGVALVILGCLGLSYSPSDPTSTIKPNRRWIPMAAGALVLWGAAQTIVKYAYALPQSSEATFALLNTFGGFLTLGLFGILFGRKKAPNKTPDKLQSVGYISKEWIHSFLPMGMMASGDLCVIIASRLGPISIVTPLTGAYPLVTVGFAALILKEHIGKLQWFCILLILSGMYLSPGS